MKDDEYLYHWTHRNNLASILATGLDPEFAEGKLKVVWCCEWTKIGYALGHIAYRHNWQPDDMVLIRFPRAGVPYAHTAWGDIYTTTARVRMKGHTSYKPGVLASWVTFRSLRKSMA